jgi:hypothetical protein
MTPWRRSAGTDVLALLLIAAIPGQAPSPIALVNHVRAEDCGPGLRDPRTLCDLAPAWDRAMAACAATSPPAAAEARPSACAIEIAAGLYETRRALVAARPVIVRGAGGWGWAARTVIRTRTSTDGIVILVSAAGSEVSDLALISGLSRHETPTAGIRVRGRARVERVWLRLFVVGLDLAADVQRGSNANGSRARDVWIDRTEGPAVLVAGGDSNAIVLDGLDVTGACERGAKWSHAAALRGAPCAAVLDYSFLGLEMRSIHTASTRDAETRETYSGLVVGLSPSARSVCVGCYSESDQAPSFLGRLSVALGGIGAWTGPGLRIEGPRLSSILVSSPTLPGGGVVDLAAGAITAPGVGLELRGAGIPGEAWRPLRVVAEPSRRAWRVDVAGLGSGVVGRVGATASAGVGALSVRTSTVMR